MIKYVFPKKILSASGVTDASNLLIKQELQIGTHDDKLAHFDPKASIVLDFGKEIRGGVRILTSWICNESKSARIRIRFGESLGECNAALGYKGACNDHAPRDFEAVLSTLSDLTFGDTGFRFVRIDAIEGSFSLKAVVAKSFELAKKPRYCYKGEDKQLRKIYAVAKRTVDLCAFGDYVYDGIKRDKLVWIGDLYPEMLALTTLYGRFSAIEKSLEFVKKQYPLPLFMYDMPTYSLWWVIITCDYYKRADCKDFIKEQLDYLQGVLRLFDERIDESGRMAISNYFVDWPTVGSVDEYVGAICIAIAAYEKGIALLEECGRDTQSFRHSLDRLRQNDLTVHKQKQGIGLKWFALGEITDEEYALLIDGGAKGFSTFMSYFIGSAIASKDKAIAIDLIKDYYGGMLQMGATTFFEDFDLDWTVGSCRIDELPHMGQKDFHGDHGKHCYVGFRHSLCHGWSAGVLTFMQENTD